jgi:hypothetical protein
VRPWVVPTTTAAPLTPAIRPRIVSAEYLSTEGYGIMLHDDEFKRTFDFYIVEAVFESIIDGQELISKAWEENIRYLESFIQ